MGNEQLAMKIERLLNMPFRKKKTLHIDENTPIDKVRYTLIDTELTGLDEKRDSIVSMAGIKMTGGRIDFEDIFNKLVNPGREISAESVVIHEITPSDVLRKPGIEEVLSDFIQFCGNDVIVGHCVSIDLSFINRDAKRILGSAIDNPALDTSVIYGWIRKRYSSVRPFPAAFIDSGLFDIAKFFEIPVSGAHNALMDAFTTAQIFQRFIPMLLEKGIRTIGDLLTIGSSSKGGDGDITSTELYGL